jgi:hypothetical protein
VFVTMEVGKCHAANGYETPFGVGVGEKRLFRTIKAKSVRQPTRRGPVYWLAAWVVTQWLLATGQKDRHKNISEQIALRIRA